ncbi:MAG: hypothetical protein Q4B86_07095 [Eubacteriales bacterium]|nr:hypothetical protein [Eubacteriales bacterium]
MGAFYGTKIKNEVINPSTGIVWNINDVPKLWVKKVEAWLNENP